MLLFGVSSLKVSHKGLSLGLLCLGLSACNSTGLDASKLKLESSDVAIATVKKSSDKTVISEHAFVAPLKTSVKRVKPRSNGEALAAAFRSNSEFYRGTGEIKQELSSRCRRILSDTGIETASLRSPTVSANLTSDYDYGFGASYDFIDLKRANLKEELALARCLRSSLSIKLTQLMVTSSQSSTRAGYLARARILRKNRSEFLKIKRAISNGLNRGVLTVSRASSLRQHLNQAMSAEARARSEASRRMIVDRILKKNFRALDHRIVASERRVHDIQERMRTVDAFKLRGSISYNIHNQGDPTIVRAESAGVTGKVKLSIRLGAFSKRRHNLEQISREARVDGYSEAESGAFWRTNQMVSANQQMISGLRKQRVDVNRALTQARHNTVNPGVEYEEELLPARIRGRIDAINLTATMAGIDATIADMKSMNSKLRYQQ